MTPNPSDDVLVSHLEGEAVVLDLATKRYVRLNATSARIWKALEAGADVDEIAEILATEFEVSPEEASSAARRHVEELAALDLVRSDG